MHKSVIKKNKTVQYLDDAFIFLLQKKTYDQITIRNLIEKAGISRTSFYANFVDIHDFFTHFVTDCFCDLEAYTDKRNCNLFLREDFLQYYTNFYKYIAEHEVLFETLLGDHGLPAFRLQMIQSASGMWTGQFTRIFPDDRIYPRHQKDEIELLIAYIVSAHVGLVNYWLFNHRHLPPKYMAERLFALTWTILNVHGYEKCFPNSS